MDTLLTLAEIDDKLTELLPMWRKSRDGDPDVRLAYDGRADRLLDRLLVLRDAEAR